MPLRGNRPDKSYIWHKNFSPRKKCFGHLASSVFQCRPRLQYALCDSDMLNKYFIAQMADNTFILHRKTRGLWAMIHSPDKNSCCLSVNAMQILPVLPQQLGHKFDHTIKRSNIIQVSSFQTRKSVHRTRMPPPNAIQKKGLYVIVTGIP